MESPRGTPEYETVLESTEDLITAVQHCLGPFTSACLSKRLISEEVEQYTFTDHSNSEKARRVVSAIRDGVKTDQSRFHALVGIIEGFRHLESEVQILRESLRRNSQSHFSPRVSNSSLETDGPARRIISSGGSAQQSSMDDGHASVSNASPENDDSVFEPAILPGSSAGYTLLQHDAPAQQPSVGDTFLNSSEPSAESPMEIEESRVGCDGQACTIPAVVWYIKNVKNVRALGLFLKIEPGRLDEIERATSGGRLLGIVKEWLKSQCDDFNNSDRWKELHRVLLEPAVDEQAIAQKVAMDSAITDRPSFSSPAISPYQMSYVEKIGGKTEQCSITNVLNCIAPYSEWYQIGVCLKLPENKLDEIRGYPLADQKAHLVELWYRSNCLVSWEKLEQALTQFLEIRGRKGSNDSQLTGSSIRKSKYAAPSSRAASAVQEKDPDTIRVEIDSLHKKFRSLIKDLTKQLENSRGIEMEDVHDTLLNLPQHLHVIYSPILDEKFHSLEKCKSYREFFFKMNDCWNFIDPDLLESIIEEHGSDGLKSAMKVYAKELEMFRQSTTVHQLIEMWQPKFPKSSISDIPEVSHEHCKSLVTRLDRDARMYTIQELDCFRREAQKFAHPLSISAMILYDIISGSVTIVWLVSEDDIDTVSQLVPELVKTSSFIEQHKIVFLSFDGYIQYPEELHSKFWNACRGGDVQCARELLVDKKVDPNYTSEVLGKSVLMCAAIHGHLEVVLLLVEFEADVDAEDPEGKTALLLAVQHGHEMELLLVHGANIYHCDKNGNNILSLSKPHRDLHGKLQKNCEIGMINAAKKGDTLTLERALKIGVEPNAKEKDTYGRTALLWACENGHVDVVDYLLKHKADTSAQDECMTSLMLAVAKGHASVVCSLLETGDKGGINYQTEDKGWSALFFAYEGRHEGVVKLLVEYGADPQLKDKEKKVAADYGVVKKSSGRAKKVKDFVVEKGISFMKKSSSILKKKLLYLVEIGDYDGIKKLLEEGNMDVDVRDPSRKEWTPLMWACDEGHYEIVELLLQHRAKIELSSTTGWTPLHIACSNNFVRIAYLLLRRGADPNRVIDERLNYTPLMYISDMDDMEPMARALLKYGANLEIAAAKNGWTPLIEACHSGKEELVKLYLNHGAEVNRTANRGWTPIMAAARKDRGNIVKLLIEMGASMEMTMTDAKKKTGESAIHIASYTGSTSVIPVLVENGANPNVTNEADLSPLSIATNRNNVEIVEALLQSEDIDVNLQQKRTGLTALFLAAKNGHVEIFKKLLQHGASDEINIGGQTVSVREVVHVFKKSKRDIIKTLEKHKLEVEQIKQVEVERIKQERLRVQERSEVEQLQGVQLPAEKPTKEHTVVPKEEVVEPPGPLTSSLEVAEETTGVQLLGQDTTVEISVEKESETEEEPVASAPSEAAVTPALQETGLPNSQTSNQEESYELSQLDEAPQDDKEPSLSESEAKDSSSETSSLYAAEEVCETPKDQGREMKALSQAEKKKNKDRFIRNCFDAHAASWKHTQSLNEDQQEYSGKGLRSLDIYRNFTDIHS